MPNSPEVYKKSLRSIFDLADLAGHVKGYSVSSRGYLARSVGRFNMSKYIEDLLSDMEIEVLVDDYNSIILNKDMTVYCAVSDYLGHVLYFGYLVQGCLDFLSDLQGFIMSTVMMFGCDADMDKDDVMSTYYSLYEVLDVFSSPAIVLSSENEKNTLMQNIVRLANFIPVLSMYLRYRGHIYDTVDEDVRNRIYNVMASLANYLVRTLCEVMQLLNKAYVNLESLPVMLDETKSVVRLKGKVPLVAFGTIFGNRSGILSELEKITSSVHSRRLGSTKKPSPKNDIVAILKDVAEDISSIVGGSQARVNSNADNSDAGSTPPGNTDTNASGEGKRKGDNDSEVEDKDNSESSLAAYL